MTEVLSENYGRESENLCPKCKGNDLDYGQADNQQDGRFYPVTCPDCGFEGTQEYKLVFVCFTNHDGTEI